jgi:hypothetical protein
MTLTFAIQLFCSEYEHDFAHPGAADARCRISACDFNALLRSVDNLSNRVTVEITDSGITLRTVDSPRVVGTAMLRVPTDKDVGPAATCELTLSTLVAAVRCTDTLNPTAVSISVGRDTPFIAHYLLGSAGSFLRVTISHPNVSK